MKIKQLLFGLITFLFILSVNAQVGIGNTNPQSLLDISASSTTSPANDDGVLIPRMSNFPSAPGSTRDGLLIFYTGTGSSGKGFYYWNTTSWIFLTGAKKIDDLADGKSDFDGTNDGSSIYLGINSGATDDLSDNRNVGVGFQSLQGNLDGANNTAIGYNSLLSNTNGNENTAVGNASLDANTTGIWNTGVGQSALGNNVNGAYNTAVGRAALAGNLSGASNVALGVNAYGFNSTGSFNTVIGVDAATALNSSSNTIIGRRAMNSYTSGGENVAIGSQAGYYGSGVQNTYIGTTAGFTVSSPIRNGSVFLGYGAGSSETTSNKLYIENSVANANSALIYGEFDTNILRTNGQFQIGNPSIDGYAFPYTDGTSGQVLTTNGLGYLSWNNLETISARNGITKIFDQVELGGTLVRQTTITHGNNNLTHYLNGGGEFIVSDNGTPKFIVNNNGNVGIGDNATVSPYQLNVEDSQANNFVANFRNTNNSLNADGIAIRLSSGTSSNNRFINFYRSGGNINNGSVRGSGFGVNYATTSDRRLKTNISDIENALSLITNIQPRLYQYKAFPEQTEYGFIAQELQLIYPQAVSGNPDDDITKSPMMVDYSRLTPILTAGIKELNTKVEILEAENKSLKRQLSKLQQLEARIINLENTTN